MLTKRQQSEYRQLAPARPPAWFRYGVVAAATLILCSCQALGPINTALPGAVATAVAPRLATAPSSQAFASEKDVPDDPVLLNGEQANTSKRLPDVPAVYIQDSHTPPPPARQAEYQARPRSASFETPACQACEVPNPGPIVRPRDEYLCDGGDEGQPAVVRKDWQVEGLQQEDTVAHYDTVDGRTVVTSSNRVCIYAPRFGVVRQVVDLHEYARYDMASRFNDTLALTKIDESEKAATSLAKLEPTIHRIENPPSLLLERQQLGELDGELRVAEFDGTLAPYANLQIIRIGTMSNNEKALVARASLAAILWTGDQAPQISIDSKQAQAAVSQRQPGVVYHQMDPTKPRLRLIKLASSESALPGEEIEFTLRFDNIGSQVMGNVTIVDHLTTRLEYLPDSFKSSVETSFSLQPNTTGSAVLRWGIKEPLEAGKGGVLQFRCKVL